MVKEATIQHLHEMRLSGKTIENRCMTATQEVAGIRNGAVKKLITKDVPNLLDAYNALEIDREHMKAQVAALEHRIAELEKICKREI